MDDISADAFANRDAPIPVVAIGDLSDGAGSDGQHHKKDRFRSYGSSMKEHVKKASGKTPDTGSSIQDRLLEK